MSKKPDLKPGEWWCTCEETGETCHTFGRYSPLAAAELAAKDFDEDDDADLLRIVVEDCDGRRFRVEVRAERDTVYVGGTPKALPSPARALKTAMSDLRNGRRRDALENVPLTADGEFITPGIFVYAIRRPSAAPAWLDKFSVSTVGHSYAHPDSSHSYGGAKASDCYSSKAAAEAAIASENKSNPNPKESA